MAQKKKAKYHYNKASKFLKLKRYYEALEEIQKSLTINPNFLKAYIKQGEIYEELKDSSSAAHCYEEYLKRNPKNQKILDFLVIYYTKNENFKKSGETLEKRASIEKKKYIKNKILRTATKMYIEGENYYKAEKILIDLLKENFYSQDIYQDLKTIYHRMGKRRKWKSCREILQIDKKFKSNAKTDSVGIFKVKHPLTLNLYNNLCHPGEKNFNKYFSWMHPLFKILEQPVSKEIINMSKEEKDEKFYPLYQECCQYLNLEPPLLLLYQGAAKFKFLVNPIEKSNFYQIIYHQNFIDKLTNQERAFIYLNHLTLIRSHFIPLLNLSLSDITKILMEIASFIFGILTFLQTAPVGKAANFLAKILASQQVIEKITNLQKKISKIKPLGKSPEEMQSLIKSSVKMMPDKIKKEEKINRKTLLNKNFLESTLSRVYYTADRIAYYFTRNLIVSTKSLTKLMDTENTLKRIEKFGLIPFFNDNKNILLKKRLKELYLFSIDSDILDDTEKHENPKGILPP